MPITAGVPITLGDKERHLVLNLNAMEAFEDITGKSFLTGFDLDPKKLRTKELKALVWACLKDEDETITLKDVGKWIDMNNASIVFGAVLKAVTGALPEPKDNGTHPNTESLSDGSNSGQSVGTTLDSQSQSSGS
jgi:hypothetical protein